MLCRLAGRAGGCAGCPMACRRRALNGAACCLSMRARTVGSESCSPPPPCTLYYDDEQGSISHGAVEPPQSLVSTPPSCGTAPKLLASITPSGAGHQAACSVPHVPHNPQHEVAAPQWTTGTAATRVNGGMEVEVQKTTVEAHTIMKTFYRRTLPLEYCVPFSSTEGRKLFQEALEEGSMESYFPLSENFLTQDEPAFCGLGALTMVLNALAIDPGRIWKGPWRWFDESMLECCEPLDVVRTKGICIHKLDCLANCNGATSVTKYGDVTSVEEFREDIMRITCQTPPPDELMIVGYNRQVLGQTGTGHFSPIGGYHRGKDLALIMDVARFKYPPHWVPVTKLWDAMKTIDPETGRSRGYMVVGKGLVSQSMLFTIDKSRYREFEDLTQWLLEQKQSIPLMLSSGPPDYNKLVPTFLSSLPPSIASMVTTYHEALCLRYSERHMTSIGNLLHAIEAHPAYEAMTKQDQALLARFKEGWSGCCARKVVTELHLLSIMYISVLEWTISGLRHSSGFLPYPLFPSASFSPALQLEVCQLKKKFAAMTEEWPSP